MLLMRPIAWRTKSTNSFTANNMTSVETLMQAEITRLCVEITSLRERIDEFEDLCSAKQSEIDALRKLINSPEATK